MPKRVRRKNVYYGEPVKANLLYSLPQELITLIYSFDDTYTTKFNYVLGELKYHDIHQERYDYFLGDITDLEWNVADNQAAQDLEFSLSSLDTMHFELQAMDRWEYMHFRSKLYLKIKEKFYIEYLEWSYIRGHKYKYEDMKGWNDYCCRGCRGCDSDYDSEYSYADYMSEHMHEIVDEPPEDMEDGYVSPTPSLLPTDEDTDDEYASSDSPDIEDID